MTAISHCFESLARNACADSFITAGDPDLETTAKALQVLDAMVQILLNWAYLTRPVGGWTSDSSRPALQRGTRLEQVLEMVESVSPTLADHPLHLHNPI